MPENKRPGYSIFFDFDNTITLTDILDNIIEKFSVDKKWVGYELLWKKGDIGSKKCLEGQLASVRVSKTCLCRFLSGVRLDPGFKKLLRYARGRGINPVILSDNFSFIIKYILRKNKISGLRVYSNTIRFDKGRLFPEFPHVNSSCRRCGHCKKNNLFRDKKRDKIIYIGDGLSDICAAKHSDIVFAKGSLLKHFNEKKIDCIKIDSLVDVLNHFKKGKIDGTKTKKSEKNC